MDLCAIGARIKAAREKAGMTQEDLAAALEMRIRYNKLRKIRK